MRYIISLLLTSTAAMAEVPNVVTDIPPVHSLTAAVMGDLGTPALLLDRGASPHSFQFRPSQMGEVQAADLVIWMGPTLTPWLEKPLSNRAEGAPILGLLDAPGTYLQEFGQAKEAEHDHEDHAAEAETGHDDHDHAAEAEVAAEADHDDHADHNHSGLDPHAWLDPANGKLWLTVIAAELSRLDPENAATYTANAATAAAAIDTAEAQAKAVLAPVKDRPFFAFHDAYNYYTGHFGLNMAGTVALGDATSPGAQRLTELRETIAQGAVTCIYPEAQHDPALAAQMAEDTGITLGGVLDPSGSTMEPGADLYPALILSLAETIAACQP